MAHFRADLVQEVASTQNRKCLRVLPVQQEVLFGYFQSDQKHVGVLSVKPKVLMVSTGSSSSHFLSTADGPIKASTAKGSVLNKRSVICFLSSFEFVYCAQLLEFGYLRGQRLISFMSYLGEYYCLPSTNFHAIRASQSNWSLVQPTVQRLHLDTSWLRLCN